MKNHKIGIATHLNNSGYAEIIWLLFRKQGVKKAPS